MTKQISIKTKFGWISVFENQGKINRLKFGKIKKQVKSKLLVSCKKKIQSFFNKKSLNINITHNLEGNRIQKKVWGELKKIKKGNVKSYGEIAKKYKLSPRHVGKICSQNKLLLIVPCHRVIKTDGRLGGFTSNGGVNLKKKLLEFERN
jgi:methylated-DNA-[protein]-cysteine S-methyltransferase